MIKKIFLFIILLINFIVVGNKIACAAAINVDKFLTPDTVTIEALENMRSTFQSAINSSDGSLLQGTSVSSGKLDANSNPENRWNEAFNDFVYTGILPPTSTTLTAVTTAGTAYVNGVRIVKDATSKAYTASKHTYVDLSSVGTYTYIEVAINAPEPSVTGNSIRLARVSTDSTKVLSVRDDRITTVSTSSFFVGTFTRDIFTATGTQAVTGVGFKPKAILFHSAVASAAGQATLLAFTDGTTSRSIRDNANEAAGTYQQGGSIASISTAVGSEYIGTLSSFDVDGFTVSWTKTGTPTGTVSVEFIAIR